jgi:O-antigen/teichoic acid export membrane protein
VSDPEPLAPDPPSSENLIAVDLELSPEFDALRVGEGGHAQRLARGAVLQQGAQVIRLVGGFFVLTLLAHRLSLAELGTYTILLSLITYVAFVKSSVMNAAVTGVAEAAGTRDVARLSAIVSTGLVIYSVIGIISGIALCGFGLALLPSLNIPHRLYHSAQLGVVGLSVVTLLSWPLQIFDDLLRGLQRFAAVSVLEISAMVVYVSGATVLAFTGAPVWSLVTLNAGIPLLMGLACLVALRRLGIRVGVSLRLIDRQESRRFGSFSGLLLVSGVADLATYSLDRFILSAFRSPSVVGLYEGPLGAQNMIRYLNGVLTSPGVPVTATFLASGDLERVRGLCLRAIRYAFAATVPFVVVMIVDSGPVLGVWLGARFRTQATPAAVFSSWWLIGANFGFIAMILYGGRRTRLMVVGSWSGAIVNVGLALLLTRSLGIYGPIIGSMTGLTVSLAIWLPYSLKVAGVHWGEAAREAWLPAYLTGLVLAGVLYGLRYGLGLISPLAVVLTMVLAPVLYWALYALVWLRPDERQLALHSIGLSPERLRFPRGRARRTP